MTGEAIAVLWAPIALAVGAHIVGRRMMRDGVERPDDWLPMVAGLTWACAFAVSVLVLAVARS